MLLREHRYPDIHADVSDVCAGVFGCGGVRAFECMSVFLEIKLRVAAFVGTSATL